MAKNEAIYIDITLGRDGESKHNAAPKKQSSLSASDNGKEPLGKSQQVTALNAYESQQSD